MSDDIIKNPARANIKVQQPYEPEYRKMGIDPTPSYSATKTEYASVDSIIIDDLGNASMFETEQMIDNNEFVNIDNGFLIKQKQQQIEKLDVPNVGDYVLMVADAIIATGTFDTIQERVKSIVYGEDKTTNEWAPTIDDIVVLKRIGIKVGVFLDD